MVKKIRVASDVGGTFTDSIAYDEVSGTITVSKVSTTPENRAKGTVEGLKRAIDQHGASGNEVDYVGHGMTTATNAVIQRNGALTAFLTNHGFKDLLEIGRQNRPTLFDISIVKPGALVDPELCFTARGRIDASGLEVEPLNEADVIQAAQAMHRAGVKAVGVLFLHSYANPGHEQRARALLEQHLPGVHVCASTDVSREFREYERASTTVLNAYLRPVMDRYLRSLYGMLVDETDGLALRNDVPVMVMDAAGGLMSLESARSRPVSTVLSGPAGGVVASAHVARRAGIDHIITMDIGGTSTDISLIRKGRPEITRSAVLETVPIRIPVIDINAIGAGGGSIAWIDEGGALRVGPMSAEAVPGPACYGRGGERPTVTDANLVLGRFDGKSRLGGSLSLNVEAAFRVIRDAIAEPLDITVYEAAAGILRVAHSNIVRGIRVVSVERGYDPRDFALVPFGGAGPMHGSPVARELRMPRVMIPPTPGILCAMGQLISDLRHDFVATHIAAYADQTEEDMSELVLPLVQQGLARLEREGIAPEQRQIEVRLEVRYVGQSYDLPILVDFDARDYWKTLPVLFHEAHQVRFGYADPSAPIEIVGINVTAIGRIDTPVLPSLAHGGSTPPSQAHAGRRKIYFEPLDAHAKGQLFNTPVYRRSELMAGNVITGPAIIEEVSATTVLYPGDVLTAHESGNLIVEVAQ
ncbi:hydantoinase/oxoprolinase family protein [Gluconacetobacter azotocaptans]|uniref:Hydantoinase/oxoprolinase family protein n=1 Tax=Gluconacetobacter azotocaptans TaxID=142834 RepID=A0A7W4JU33_9PROT|nr:hydantoinase/oxoprolinase family protein [Gluconacetobacter azotocaptans]MBB2190805.1 hydantoinase/oxoprolinase family protein [Gluconacetobacter azotocaptans]MBM9400749.1 hydantoinase/oxoprolinase family protein [Gluconacetobacter azotocaptans]GBQ30836.1 N-methylhydantoinase A [Gluconacetobacter azotocaptans DSM 13594]